VESEFLPPNGRGKAIFGPLRMGLFREVRGGNGGNSLALDWNRWREKGVVAKREIGGRGEGKTCSNWRILNWGEERPLRYGDSVLDGTDKSSCPKTGSGKMGKPMKNF
jgi:hypothetical protein